MSEYIDVWAQTGDVQTTVCADARLRYRESPYDEIDSDHPGMTFVDLGNTWGQAGWDAGLRYEDTDDLLRKLRHLKAEGRLKGVRRLVIHAHGEPGKVFINGRKGIPLTGRDQEYKQFLKELRELFPPHGGQLIFMSCRVAAGSPTFLEKISADLPNVDVVAFENVGYSELPTRPGTSPQCTAPGMRMTPFAEHAGQELEGTGREKWYDDHFSDLSVLPWATPLSKFAAVAHNGRIIKHATTTNIPFDRRIARYQDFPQRRSLVRSRNVAEDAALTVELTDDEARVYASLPGWRDVTKGKAKPVPWDSVAYVSGLPRHRAVQAMNRLNRKLLVMPTRYGEISGYARTR
jgi:hypothetical protein